MTVVVGASVVDVVVSTSSTTGGGVEASAAVAYTTIDAPPIITIAATRPNFARIEQSLVDRPGHEAVVSSTAQSNCSPSTTSTVAIEPASTRSAVPARNESCLAAGNVTLNCATSARWLTFASVLVRRTRATASSVGSMSAASPPPAVQAGRGGAWLLPCCHQLHVSSVANGRIGAISRCSVLSARQSAARADVAPS